MLSGFNPRPLLLTGESCRKASRAAASLEFQSTPVIANGRIGVVDLGVLDDGLFQSTPVIANGRIEALRKVHKLDPPVSIHARYC